MRAIDFFGLLQGCPGNFFFFKRGADFFVSPLDGDVSPTAAGRGLRQSGGRWFSGSTWPSEGEGGAGRGLTLPRPEGAGAIWLGRVNQGEQETVMSLHFNKAMWFKG